MKIARLYYSLLLVGVLFDILGLTKDSMVKLMDLFVGQGIALSIMAQT